MQSHYLLDKFKKLPNRHAVPKKTVQSTQWAVRIFTEWLTERNSCLGESVALECPPDLLEQCNQNQYGYPNETLDHWLAAFVTEVRQSNGKQYTATSLNCILAGIYRHLKSKLNDRAPKFLEKKAVNSHNSLSSHVQMPILNFPLQNEKSKNSPAHFELAVIISFVHLQSLMLNMVLLFYLKLLLTEQSQNH